MHEELLELRQVLVVLPADGEEFGETGEAGRVPRQHERLAHQPPRLAAGHSRAARPQPEPQRPVPREQQGHQEPRRGGQRRRDLDRRLPGRLRAFPARVPQPQQAGDVGQLVAVVALGEPPAGEPVDEAVATEPARPQGPEPVGGQPVPQLVQHGQQGAPAPRRRVLALRRLPPRGGGGDRLVHVDADERDPGRARVVHEPGQVGQETVRPAADQAQQRQRSVAAQTAVPGPRPPRPLAQVPDRRQHGVQPAEHSLRHRPSSVHRPSENYAGATAIRRRSDRAGSGRRVSRPSGAGRAGARRRCAPPRRPARDAVPSGTPRTAGLRRPPGWPGSDRRSRRSATG